jgi:glyoxylase-like metal-dependent hydrolase (beta-lactamase superfamily II)
MHKAIVIGDAFMDGNAPPLEWATDDPAAPERLRALLELPFELVLPTHGDVTDRPSFEASVAP